MSNIIKTIVIILLTILLVVFAIGIKNSGREVITISKLRFIGEYIIPDTLFVGGTLVGGISGIDFLGEKWILISDDHNPPIRYYTASLNYDLKRIHSLDIESVVEFLNSEEISYEANREDPEAIRYDSSTGTIIWSSEGNINKDIAPSINESNISGKLLRTFDIPELITIDTLLKKSGYRHNGTFEGLSISMDRLGFWVVTELPLIQDGEIPVFDTDTDSPVRISFIDRQTGETQRQFAYELDPVVREGSLMINGVSEILEYDINKFLVIERSFAKGYDDGGNDIRIYKIDVSGASDVLKYESLRNKQYKKVAKTLLFDFETIREHLSAVTGGTEKVDNIEGISFGNTLSNGNESIVVVSDNNFNKFGLQLNQFIVFEVIP